MADVRNLAADISYFILTFIQGVLNALLIFLLFLMELSFKVHTFSFKTVDSYFFLGALLDVE